MTGRRTLIKLPLLRVFLTFLIRHCIKMLFCLTLIYCEYRKYLFEFLPFCVSFSSKRSALQLTPTFRDVFVPISDHLQLLRRSNSSSASARRTCMVWTYHPILSLVATSSAGLEIVSC